jgi:nucleoside-diphosphate-sugar epimerase
MTTLNTEHLDAILSRTRDVWEEFRGKELFLTGATGFVGCWLLESFTWACDRLSLNAHVHALTRDPKRFAAKAPHLAGHPAVMLVEGDVRTFPLPAGRFSHIIHGAAQPSMAAAEEQEQRAVIVEGTRRVLSLAQESGTPKMLFISSGAVYGTQQTSCSHMPEDEAAVQRPLATPSAYAEGKRAAERLWKEAPGIPTIARCYAFAGPYLPLDAQYAIGNFVRDGLKGGPIRVQGDGTPFRSIRVQGDGTPFRSYLYAADLAVWLWTILCKGQAGRAYNVGSEHAINILDLAHTVASALPSRPVVEVLRTPAEGIPPSRYVPSTLRARTELHLTENYPLGEAIRAMISWYATR